MAVSERNVNSKYTLEDKVNQLNTIMVAVVIVLLIGFASLLVAVWGLGINYLDNSRGAKAMASMSAKARK